MINSFGLKVSFEVITNHKDIWDTAIDGLELPYERCHASISCNCGSLVPPTLSAYNLQSISALQQKGLATQDQSCPIAVVKQSMSLPMVFAVMHVRTSNLFYLVVEDFT